MVILQEGQRISWKCPETGELRSGVLITAGLCMLEGESPETMRAHVPPVIQWDILGDDGYTYGFSLDYLIGRSTDPFG